MRAHSKPDRRLPPVAEPSPLKLQALCYVLSARLTELETSNRELRAAAGLSPPPAALGAEWMTVKHAMHATNFSHTHVRKLIKQGRLSAIKVGGHVLVSTESVEALLRAKDSLASSNRPAA